MSRYERRYEGGEIIFKEGEPADCAYVLVSGQIELVKMNGAKAVRLSLLMPGEMFGEMGLVDSTPRSATARAVGEVIVDVVAKDEFLKAVRETPDVALTVIANLAERLRTTNDLVSQPVQRDVRRPVPQRRMGFWEQFRQLVDGGRKPVLTLKILVAQLHGDPDNVLSKRILEALNRHKSIRVLAVPEFVGGDPSEVPAERFAGATSDARAWLVREDAHLLIWGEVNETGSALNLRFVSHARDDEIPGAFYASDRLSLPIATANEYWPLLTATTFAAMVPRTELERGIQRSLVAPAYETVQETAHAPPVALSLTDQASIQVCYANLAALMGHFTNDSSAYRRAGQIYQDALDTISREQAPLDWATLQRHLGIVRQLLGERANDNEILGNALAAYQSALEVFTRQSHPWDWAGLQSRLGSILYRLDTLDTDSDYLRDAVTAYQSALKVFSRSDAPLRWAEVKNGLGQALQVWGDITRNPELLKHAVQSCQEALQVRSKELTPLLWAASQNNLGSALFMLGKLSNDSEHLEGSAEAFGKALEVYQSTGAARLAKVAERNMSKVEEMLRARVARRVAAVYWEEETEPSSLDGDQADNQTRH